MILSHFPLLNLGYSYVLGQSKKEFASYSTFGTRAFHPDLAIMRFNNPLGYGES